MSLFDVIRYPVTDVFSNEINSYPREIMVPWATWCHGHLGARSDMFYIDKCQSFSAFAHMLILRADLKIEIAERIKEYFAIDLRRRIREHE